MEQVAKTRAKAVKQRRKMEQRMIQKAEYIYTVVADNYACMDMKPITLLSLFEQGNKQV